VAAGRIAREAACDWWHHHVSLKVSGHRLAMVDWVATARGDEADVV
jgi:hypothetical protein